MNSDSDWSRLVASPAVIGQLTTLETLCRHAGTVEAGRWAPTRLRPGVHAVFAGPDGTGKTLAAEILAARLGKAVYRVDLAAVVSRYVGETEKNLYQAFAAAGQASAVLLFDDADSLFGKRAEVRDAHDRYANLDISYLLERIENYEGIVILATNASHGIDAAFLRRMHMIVEFRLPSADERRQIWQRHLPARHALDDAWLAELATRCLLTGAQIRNAALASALLTPGGGGGAVQRSHLEDAIRSEYRKAGSACPL